MTHELKEDIDLSKRINVRWELTRKAHSNILAQQKKFENKTGLTISQQRLINKILEKAKI